MSSAWNARAKTSRSLLSGVDCLLRNKVYRPACRIQAETKYRMCYEALQARRGWAWCPGGGDAGTHTRLHQQEGRRNGTYADSESGTDRRVLNP